MYFIATPGKIDIIVLQIKIKLKGCTILHHINIFNDRFYKIIETTNAILINLSDNLITCLPD